jgi:hypothetical protein
VRVTGGVQIALCVSQVVFNTLWLLPLRLLLIIVPTVVMGVAVCVLSILGERMDEENPHPQRSWRRFLTNTIGGYLSRLLLFGMGFQWIRVRGSPASTADAPLWVVSPHSCILDMIVVSMFHLPTYVAKREVRSTPLFGRESPPSLTSVTSHMRLSRASAHCVQISSLTHCVPFMLLVTTHHHGNSARRRSYVGLRTGKLAGLK